MEDLLGFLFFLIVFILGPLLGQMKKGQQQGPQQRPRQAPRVPPAPSRVPPAPSRVPSASRTEEVSRRNPEPEPQSAAEMLPDELWEILTGQKRPSPTPTPPTRYEEAEPDEEAEWVEAIPEEIRGREEIRVEERSLETYEPHEVPVVVSMETLPPPPRIRHAQFHERIAQPVAAATAKPTPSAAARLTALARRGTLRDVIVLQEVLGRPKGLE